MTVCSFLRCENMTEAFLDLMRLQLFVYCASRAGLSFYLTMTWNNHSLDGDRKRQEELVKGYKIRKIKYMLTEMYIWYAYQGFMLGYWMAMIWISTIYKNHFSGKAQWWGFSFFLCFQDKLASGPFLQDKVKECFKDNPHCLTLVMNPDVCVLCNMSYSCSWSLAENISHWIN